jgi:hypothetical protein
MPDKKRKRTTRRKPGLSSRSGPPQSPQPPWVDQAIGPVPPSAPFAPGDLVELRTDEGPTSLVCAVTQPVQPSPVNPNPDWMLTLTYWNSVSGFYITELRAASLFKAKTRGP